VSEADPLQRGGVVSQPFYHPLLFGGIHVTLVRSDAAKTINARKAAAYIASICVIISLTALLDANAVVSTWKSILVGRDPHEI
jgi:hypothetical protein